MKILLDECVTKNLLNYLTEFEVYTVRYMGIGGVKNGKLMSFCHENNFDILLTIDKNLMFQQNLNKYNIAIVVLNCETSKIEELVEFMPTLKSKINSFEKHKAYIIEK